MFFQKWAEQYKFYLEAHAKGKWSEGLPGNGLPCVFGCVDVFGNIIWKKSKPKVIAKKYLFLPISIMSILDCTINWVITIFRYLYYYHIIANAYNT